MSDSMFNEARQKMQKALDHLHEEYGKLQTGRAHAGMVEGVMVNSYGSMMPLKAVATVSVPESNQIAIQPWNRGDVTAVKNAIIESNLGLNPQDDGVVIRLIIPQLTEERRKSLVKIVHQLSEEARISIRNARQEAHTHIKQMKKDNEVGEDEMLRLEKQLQDLVDEFNEHVEASAKKKEEDVMRV